MAINKRLLVKPPSSGVTPSENFKVVLYTGNGGTQSITGVGFKPDFVWIKDRGADGYHAVHDSTRGATKGVFTNVNNAEYTGLVTSLDTDGFTVNHTKDGSDNNTTNRNGGDFVAWCWKARGGTTSTNTDGSNIDSTVQVNANAGFSIVKWTGTGNAAHTVGHGLGATPNMVLSKNLDQADTWQVYHSGAGILAGTSGTLLKYGGHLDGSAAFNTSAGTHGAWNTPSSTALTFSNGSSSIDNLNTNSEDYIAYCFADIDGFSKFSAYEGNGSANGPIVETGFEPAFVLVKGTSHSGSWIIFDNKRNTTNPRTKILYADSNTTDTTNANIKVDFLSNGFQLTGTDTDYNGDGRTYIYMAFAADPDTEAPTLASSFNIETWSGTGSSNSITGLGFAPNLVWLKQRGGTTWHNIQDTINGATKHLYTNSDNALDTTSDGLTSFDSDGFTLGSGNGFNGSGQNMVAWTWKADDNEPTIFNGSARTVYKFEDNANDVTGAYNATASNVSYVTGYFNKAAEFNGSNSTMFLASSGSSLVDYDLDFSISLWFNVSSWATQASRDFLWTGGGTRIININLTGSTGLDVDIWNSGSHLVSTTGLSENTWYHLVFTRSKVNGMKLYIDGSIVDTNPYIGNAGSLSGKQDSIGTYWDNTRNNFTGKIDQFRIYDGVVTDDDVTALYAETASQNDDLTLGGPPKTIISANANAGMSIVKYTGTYPTHQKIPHGLSAAPNVIIIKNLADSADWEVYHSGVGATKNFVLNDTAAPATNSGFMADTAPTATVFTVGNDGYVNGAGDEHIAYCFHDVSGYSKFGTYTGNGSAGQAITTGFKPDFVLIKSTVGADNWRLYDTRRGITGGGYLEPNRSDADDTSNAPNINILSNGFEITAGGTSVGNNVNGNLYTYYAFAKNVPSNTTLANSFKAITYTGTGSSQSITGTGFKPDLVWIKQRSGTQDQMWYDNNRGAGHYLSSNNANAQGYANTTLTSFDADGFSVGSSNSENQSGQTFVAWCWKAGNTWQSNIEGSIPSITNTNTANGFSIVKYTGTGANTTVGHNLGAAPEVMIIKDLDNTRDWAVYHIGNTGSSGNANEERLKLNLDVATTTYAPYWNGTTPTSTVFSLGNEGNVNTSGQNYIAYCWTPKSGYSKFGSYTGTGSSGNAQDIGFQPDFVIIKSTAQYNWEIYDTQRPSGSIAGRYMLLANASDTEYTTSAVHIDITSTGFSFPNGYDGTNKSSQKFIYMAFKMN